jgi:hypothetical protein
MAGMIPSFLSSSKLVIRIGDIQLAYGSNLSFNHRMAVAPVGGIGSYNADALEPLQYTAGGSFAVTVYNSEAITALKNAANAPGRVLNPASSPGTNGRDGNSMLLANNFSPAILMLSETFDIDVYERVGAGITINNINTTAPSLDNVQAVYVLHDCRLTSYSITFTPGSLVQENIGFLCISIEDKTLPTT